MNTEHAVKFEFNFNWKLTLFALLLLPILFKLGLWQLERAEEKRSIESSWSTQQSLEPLSVETLSPEFAKSSNFQRVILFGEFATDEYWLQENQVRNGKLGFQVIMPFMLASGDVLAVDRGWVEGSPLREFYPEIETPDHKLQVSGTLVLPSDSKLVREAEVSVKRWPHKILEVDIKVMSSQIEKVMFPKLLKLDADNQAAFVVNWQPTNMSPTKHVAYAVQWFALFITLIILYFVASTNIVDWVKQRKS